MRNCCAGTPNWRRGCAARWNAACATGAPGTAPTRRWSSRRSIRPDAWGLSDFTAANDLGVIIAGAPLVHLRYHFRLPYSGFEHAAVVVGGRWRARQHGPERRSLRARPIRTLWAVGLRLRE